MKFYIFGSRQRYSGGSELEYDGYVKIPRVKPVYLQKCTKLTEHRDRGIKTKLGDFCSSGYGYYFDSKIIPLLTRSAHENIITSKTEFIDGGSVDFYQAWVSNSVNCLDLKKSQLSTPYDWFKRKTGIIRGPVFDESKWDGSDLFIVPQDPVYLWFCTERFVDEWKTLGFKGAEFRTHAMDMNPIKC